MKKLSLLLTALIILGTEAFAATIYSSSAVTQISTSTSAGATNQEILRVAITLTNSGAGSTINTTQMVFSTLNTANTDVTAAKLYYTGISSTFATTTQVGSTITNPAGTMTFNFTQAHAGSGVYYFWIAYDISATAATCNTIDAQLTSLTCNGTTYPAGTPAPTTPNPTGYRTIPGFGCWSYCSASSTSSAAGQITNVTFNTINNTTAWATGGYLNSGLSTTVQQGMTYTLSLTRTTAQVVMYTAAWIDWNNNGVFDTGEDVMPSTLDATTGSVTRTVSVTVPTTAAVGSTVLRVRLNYNADAPSCGATTYGEIEDYIINITAGVNMSYVSSTVTQASTATVMQGSTSNAILGIQVVTTGALNPINMSSLTFNTTGSTNAATDIALARIYYTGTSSTYSATTPVGTVTYSPNGTTVVSISPGTDLSPGTNYFWLAYNINNTATINNVVDAQCTSLTVGGVARTPSATNPAGTRQIVAFTTGTYCSPTGGNSTGSYTSNVSFDAINNTTVKTGSPSYYNDYTSTQSTTVYIGESYDLTVDVAIPIGGCCYVTNYVQAWIDWNRDGVFSAGELIFQLSGTGTGTPRTLRYSGSVDVPAGSVIGSSRMRVVSSGSAYGGPCGAITDGEIEDYEVIIAERSPMAFASLTTTQADVSSVNAGTTKNVVIGVEITTTGEVNPLSLTSFTMNTAGTTNATGDITNARLYSSGTDMNFATTTQYGTTIAAPNGALTFTNASGVLAAGTNYFWLVYDVKATATGGDVIDATCSSVTIAGTPRTPTVTAPTGSRPIIAASNMTYVSSTTTQNTSRTAKGEVNVHVIGVEVVTSGALSPLSATSFTFNTTGTTNVGDISNAKLWYSNDINVFVGATQIGSTVAAPSGSFTITPSQVLLNGTNYFWLSYDVSATAACDPAKIDAQCTALIVGGVSRTPTVTNPLGSRTINCGTPYYSKAGTSLVVNLLSSWSSTRDGSGPSPTSFAAGSEFYVQYGHSMTTTAAVTLPVMYVENGGYVTATNLITLTDLRINTGGVFHQKVKATSGSYITNFYMENGSYWIHDNAGYLPSGGRFFEPRSNQWFYQWGGGTFPSGTAWGNVLLNGTTTGNFGMQNCLNTIQGDFEWRRIGNTNYLLDGSTETINIGGDLIFSGGWWKGAYGNGGIVVSVNVTGNLLIESGTLEDYGAGNSSSCTNLTIGGNVTVTGGTWSYNNAPGGLTKVDLSGGVASVTWSQTGGTVTLSNVNIKTGKTVTLTGTKMGDVAASRTVTAESGSALYTATYPVSGAGNFAIQANAKLGMGHTSGYTGNIALTGTKTNDAGADFIYYLGNTQNSGTFTTTAGAGTTLDPYRLRSLTIDKTSLTPVTLQQPLRVTGTAVAFTAPSGGSASNNLQLINGLLTTTTANVIQVDANATANVGSATSFVNGPIVKKGANAFTFPTGKNTYWARIQMTAPTAASDFSAEYFDVPYSNVSTMAVQAANLQLNHVSQVEHWIFDRQNGTTGNTTLKLYWESATRSFIYKCDSMAIARWNGSAWENTGPAYAGPPCSYGATGNIGFSSTVTNFSPFTFSTLGVIALNPLPIELTSFGATCTDKKVVLNWSTATETNNDYFTIEKSLDGLEFIDAGIVRGSGNSSSTQRYSFTDNNSFSGKAYYRLKQTDYNGQSEHTNVITAENCQEGNTTVNAYNNQEGAAVVFINSDRVDNYTVVLMDALGNKVLAKQFTTGEGENHFKIDISSLNAGVYFISMDNGTKATTQKIFVK